MSWIEQLSRTYDACFGQPQFAQRPLAPISTVPQTTQLHVQLHPDGSFFHASIEEKVDTTLFVSEDSATRSGTHPAANPLTEQLEYCAKGIDLFGGKEEKQKRYLAQLKAWASSPFSDPQVNAVFQYAENGTLLEDLLREKVLSATGNVLEKVALGKGKQDPLKIWVRWSVIGANQAETWSDAELAEKWRKFEASQSKDSRFCMASGVVTRTTQKHPARIRFTSDRSKLISANDADGFTFRGRFDESQEALTIGYETSQKAHNALRWLIERQGTRIGERVVVAWTVANALPQPLLVDSWELFQPQEESVLPPGVGRIEAPAGSQYAGDAGQLFALCLRKAILGYRQEVGSTSDAVIMVLDSATKGRMAIPYYRELPGWDLLDRVERWHSLFAWMQTTDGGERFIGAPAPQRIADSVFGRLDRERNTVQTDDKLRAATIERLLPCIVDGQPVPKDLARSAFHKTVASARERRGKDKSKRAYWEFDRNLGVACSLHKATHPKENYAMSLEQERTTRDYLYGRLLAVAEEIEGRALWISGQQRETSAARLMQRFADHPCGTWRTLELQLRPYIAQLRVSRPGQIAAWLKLIDAIIGSFGQTDGQSDFLLNRPLSGEFLLGYHCQREALRQPATKNKSDEIEQESSTIEEGEDQ
jgi:CRISPR-associated protein Csd1